MVGLDKRWKSTIYNGLITNSGRHYMIPIYICEDNTQIRSHLAALIEKYILIQDYDMQIACATATPKELLQQVKEGQQGIYFLDIDLKDAEYNGFDLAKIIRKQDERGFIIFVTTHGELTFETFRLHLEALDYIVKDQPDLEERIRHCIDEIHKRIIRENGNSVQAYYTIKVNDRLHHILLDDILYFETSSTKHRLILHTESEILEFSGSLSEVEEKVGSLFLRTHRSYLININKIARTLLSDNLVELTNGETCLVARRFKKELYDLGR